jgi:hypothetical protein
MSEPIAERLSRFTPDASGLDRDALLFAAGRASARAGRGWAALALALAACQALTLACLWPRPAPPPAPAPAPAPAVEPAPPADGPAEPPGAYYRQLLAAAEDPPKPAAGEDLVPEAPPLHAFRADLPALPD